MEPANKCQICNGTGWINVEKDGREFARKCNCLKNDRIITRSEHSHIPNRFFGVKLKDFKVLDSDPEHFLYIKTVVENFVTNYPPVEEPPKGLLIRGSVGKGKTLLLCIIANELAERHPGLDIFYVDWNDLVRELRFGDYIMTRDYRGLNQYIERIANASC